MKNSLRFISAYILRLLHPGLGFVNFDVVPFVSFDTSTDLSTVQVPVLFISRTKVSTEMYSKHDQV